MADVLWLEENGIRQGTITITERDMWNFSRMFEEAEAFEKVKPLLEQAHHLTKQKRYEEWDTFYQTNILDEDFYLLKPSGEKMTEFILHINEQEAWGRLP